MKNSFIQEVKHTAVEPVTVMRDVNDVLIIEGVRYGGDFFRMMAVPSDDVLYAIQRDGDQVIATMMRNVEEAKQFFEAASATPLSPSTETSPQTGEASNLGGED